MLTNMRKQNLERQRLSPEQFEKFSAFIYSQCGIRMNENKVLLLTNRIRRRLKPSETASFDEYLRFLQSPKGKAELDNFFDVITTNETFFFRTQKHFDWLKTEFMNQLVADQRAGKRAASLNIWSAGCSSGAEPYSIAMLVAENSYRFRDWKTRILGTDISDEILSIAQEGTFKTRMMESVSPRQRRRFFRHDDKQDLYTVRQDIKQMVDFRQHNLIQKPPVTGFDCIFLCNVMIYFDSDSRKIVIKHLLDALANGGYLVLGPSEGVAGMLDSLEKISPLIFRKVAKANPGSAHVERTI
jgi:chemotaxis protein methyltransferase CheR